MTIPVLFARIHLFSIYSAHKLGTILSAFPERRAMIRSMSSFGCVARDGGFAPLLAKSLHLCSGLIEHPLPGLIAIGPTMVRRSNETRVAILLANAPSLRHLSLETVSWFFEDSDDSEEPSDIPPVASSIFRLQTLRLHD